MITIHKLLVAMLKKDVESLSQTGYPDKHKTSTDEEMSDMYNTINTINHAQTLQTA